MKDSIRLTCRPARTAVVLSLFITFMVVSVAAADVSSATVAHYIVDLVEYTSQGDESTWTYAVTADANNPPSRGAGLSHWTLGIDRACSSIVSPPDGGTFDTRLDARFGCGTTYNCTSAVYAVTHRADPELDLNGITFEHVSREPLGQDNVSTHIFQFALKDPGTTDLFDSVVGVKTGRAAETGIISGPMCDPTAVRLTSFGAGSRAFDSGIWAVISLLTLGAMTVGKALLQRRRPIT